MVRPTNSIAKRFGTIFLYKIFCCGNVNTLKNQLELKRFQLQQSVVYEEVSRCSLHLPRKLLPHGRGG